MDLNWEKANRVKQPERPLGLLPDASVSLVSHRQEGQGQEEREGEQWSASPGLLWCRPLFLQKGSDRLKSPAFDGISKVLSS